MTPSDELKALINKTFQEIGSTIDGELTQDTSLLRSGLLDSMGVLYLIAWVEGQVGVPVDLMEVDPVKHWDTMRDILRYCDEHRQAK